MTFNENDVNRDNDGRFDYKMGSAPTFSLPDQQPTYMEVPGFAAYPVEPKPETPYFPPNVESIHVYEDDTEANQQFDITRDEAADAEYYANRRTDMDFVTRTQARLTLWRGGIDKRYQRDAIDATAYGHEMNSNIVNPRAAVLGAVIENELHRRRGYTRGFGGGYVKSAQERLGILDTKAGQDRTFEDVHLVATAATDIDNPRVALSEEMHEDLAGLYKAWFETDASAKAVARSVRENGVRGTTELLTQ